MRHESILGLIGDNIAASRAPLLHRLAGAQSGLAVRYDRLVPAELGMDFEAVFARCRDAGYRGINVTYPYKERVTALVGIPDPLVRAMGVILPGQGASSRLRYNTRHSEERCSAHQLRLAAGVRLGTHPFATTLIHWSSVVSLFSRLLCLPVAF